MPITNLSLPVLTVLTIFCLPVDIFSLCTLHISNFLPIRLGFVVSHINMTCILYPHVFLGATKQQNQQTSPDDKGGKGTWYANSHRC